MKFDIDVKNVSVKYRNFEAIKDMSFHLESGKIYGFIGRNGAGKTTMLSLLACFREPTSGSITIDGENIFENRKRMSQISFVYNREWDTYEESMKVKKLLKEEAIVRPNFDMDYAEKLIRKFKLPNKKVSKLSQGMKSALHVTIGLASRSLLTIFDEAYLGMDAPTREIFYQELLEEQARQPRTMIMSTHLVSEMEYLFDEIIMIHRGQLVEQGTYEDFITKGISITGSSELIDEFTRGMKLLNTQQLGNTKRVMIFGQLSDEKLFEAQQLSLEVGTVSLQDIFIHLTGEEE